MVGQCSKLERKSIEPMALHVEGGTIRGLQRFISDVHWDEDQMLWHYHQLVAEELGEPDGVLMFDETGFVTKGKDSVGVARQYCGTLGKVENCQVGVFAGYASRQGYALVDKRLFLPEAWWTDVYAARRVRCHVPTEVTFQSKPQLAAAMLQTIAHEGLLPFKYLVADCLYGNSPDFWDAVEACVGVTAFVATPAETRCWLHRPLTMDTTYTYKGEVRSKRSVAAADTGPCTVATVAARPPASSWYQRTVSEGTKGPITYAFARQHVTLCKEGLPARNVWLVIKRTLGAEPTYTGFDHRIGHFRPLRIIGTTPNSSALNGLGASTWDRSRWGGRRHDQGPYTYYLSNAPVSTPLRTFVWLSGLRWAVEQCFEEGKTELGMAHYEVRKYPGWHHHMLMTMLAHFFLWHLKIRLGKKSSSADGIASADPPGSGLTHTRVYRGDGPRSGGMDATEESYRLSCAPQTTGG
jgi:SRSO17 transposase